MAIRSFRSIGTTIGLIAFQTEFRMGVATLTFFVLFGCEPHQRHASIATTDAPWVYADILNQTEVTRGRDHDILAIVDQDMKSWLPGSIAYEVPGNLSVGKHTLAEISVSTGKNIDELKQSLGTEGMKYGAAVKLSAVMAAQVKGVGFTITPLTDEEQIVGSLKDTETSWKWNIEPVRDGNLHLHYGLKTFVTVDGVRYSKTVFSKDIPVVVAAVGTNPVWDFVEREWKWIWAAVLAPLAAFFWQRWRAPVGTSQKPNRSRRRN